MKHERSTSVRERELRELRIGSGEGESLSRWRKALQVLLQKPSCLCGKGDVEWEGNGREGGEWRRKGEGEERRKGEREREREKGKGGRREGEAERRQRGGGKEGGGERGGRG
eukprot:CAMPEP_0181302670 /NCGR_PEP_ID=MMETSP1101-20121128/8125_1 /TAXON_ID=46948 /ORGANISM="Rhodomonas abbreviata, Strain Caron Lab Isolate" /LENGTH=111 /DNA_ID=CAMNT_0023408145 /DNA_START=1036 /DNA_END=1367 /DNA_ORIENTATION=-